MATTLQTNFRGLKPTKSIEEYIEKKLDFLDRYDKYIEHINIEVNDNRSESLSITYQVTISVKGGLLRVEEKGADLYATIDLANDILKMKMEKYKERITNKKTEKEKISLTEEIQEVNEDDSYTDGAYYTPKIAKRKIYSDNRPLHPIEAIEQMEMLGHTSFLFKDIETGKYGMVYKRTDGDYGLIEPENP